MMGADASIPPIMIPADPKNLMVILAILFPLGFDAPKGAPRRPSISDLLNLLWPRCDSKNLLVLLMSHL